MTAFYIDVSHHDRNRRGGPLDWEAIRKHTAPVMVARATYGDPDGWHRSSSYHTEFHNGAKAAGFVARGSYHNLVRGDAASIARQVDWLRRTMDAVGANWAMVDVERYEELVAADMWPRWDDVQQWCDRWHAVDDRQMVAYIPGWLYSGYYAGRDVAALGTPLVESDYGSNPGGLPSTAYATRGGDDGRGWNATGNVRPAVWQFSSNGDMPGASGNTDYNAFRGTDAQLVAFLTGQTQQVEDDVTPAEFKAILADPGVATVMRALPWQYVGGGIPSGYSTLKMFNEMFADMNTTVAKLEALVTGDDATLARIEATHQATMQRLADVDARISAAQAELVSAIVAALPAGADDVTQDEVNAAVAAAFRQAFGTTPTTENGQA